MAAPRKRASAAPRPKPEAKPEALEIPAEDGPEEAADTAEPVLPAEPEPAKGGDPDAEQPCTDCFPAGWPDGATSAGCGHGTWNRNL